MFVNQYLANGFDQSFEKNVDRSMIARTVEDAEDSFVDAKERLLDVNNWFKYAGTPGTIEFALMDGHSRPVKRRARKGDHIKVRVQGVTECCVIIDALEYDDYPDLSMETFTMRITPCIHSLPGDEDNDLTGIESSLIIERRGRHVATVFQSRDVPVGMGGVSDVTYSWFGLSEDQWNRLLKNFID